MTNFGINQFGIKKYQNGTDKNGIQLQYNGPTYSEIDQQLKESNPIVYNQIQMNAARKNNPSSEAVRYKDSNGNIKTIVNIKGMSGADPVMADYVMGVAMAKPIGAAAKYATKLIKSATKHRRLAKEMNKIINDNRIYPNYSKIPIEDGYMYHTWQTNGPKSILRDGIAWNINPGTLVQKQGKYYPALNRGTPDKIWWDTKGHNYGDNVIVTKEFGFKTSDPRSGAIPGGGAYYDSYRVTDPVKVNETVKFTWDPLANDYVPSSPFRKITTNKMTLDELFTSES